MSIMTQGRLRVSGREGGSGKSTRGEHVEIVGVLPPRRPRVGVSTQFAK
jgi:hypothetical protein